jgi:hypothetical protein
MRRVERAAAGVGNLVRDGRAEALTMRGRSDACRGQEKRAACGQPRNPNFSKHFWTAKSREHASHRDCDRALHGHGERDGGSADADNKEKIPDAERDSAKGRKDHSGETSCFQILQHIFFVVIGGYSGRILSHSSGGRKRCANEDGAERGVEVRMTDGHSAGKEDLEGSGPQTKEDRRD